MGIVETVKKRLLVFLIVTIVSERLPLHQHQQCGQVPHSPAAPAAHQFCHIRVFLLRHDAGSGAEGISQIHKPKMLGRPQDQLFGHPGKVHHHQRNRSAEFEDEIPVRHSVQGIAADTLKAQGTGSHVPVDGKSGAG